MERLTGRLDLETADRVPSFCSLNFDPFKPHQFHTSHKTEWRTLNYRSFLATSISKRLESDLVQLSSRGWLLRILYDLKNRFQDAPNESSSTTASRSTTPLDSARPHTDARMTDSLELQEPVKPMTPFAPPTRLHVLLHVLRRYSDEFFLLWRLFGGGFVFCCYMSWFILTPHNYHFLTHLTALVSFFTVGLNILLQSVTYASFYKAGCLYRQTEDDRKHSKLLQEAKQRGCIGCDTITSRAYHLAHILTCATVPANLIVCGVYWYMIYWNDHCTWNEELQSYVDCEAPSFANLLVHGFGGWYLQLDWILTNTFWLFYNGWILSALAAMYTSFLSYRYWVFNETIYVGITPNTTGGLVILIGLNVAVIPVISFVMAVIKYRSTKSFLGLN